MMMRMRQITRGRGFLPRADHLKPWHRPPQPSLDNGPVLRIAGRSRDHAVADLAAVERRRPYAGSHSAMKRAAAAGPQTTSRTISTASTTPVWPYA
jgi:hypothetical protein